VTRKIWIVLIGVFSACIHHGLAQGADGNFQGRRGNWPETHGFGSGRAGGADEPPASRAAIISTDALAALQAALRRYRQIATTGGWPEIAKGPSLRTGDTDARVADLRRRLVVEGDLANAYASGTEFDGRLEEALRRYQERNGLRASGVLNGETLDSLNVPVHVRLVQLTRSTEQVAELLPQTEAGPYVLVNVPSYELQFVSGGRVLLYSRVIVGKPATPTPSLTATIRAVDFLPYWHVPPSIAERAVIPAVRKDPAYLVRERIRVFSAWGGKEVDPAQINWFAPNVQRYVFRQDPGPHNALGLIRIDMPNRHTVYMHDTPMKQLFSARSRAYSAGCVRVHGVFALAGLLLGEDERAVRQRLAPLLASGAGASLKVATPVPVHFAYLTAWADARGRAEFRHDVYRKDAQIADLAGSAHALAPEPDPWHTRVNYLSP
jgi:murein L,D-transpeptidase YcbB/YkuD